MIKRGRVRRVRGETEEEVGRRKDEKMGVSKVRWRGRERASIAEKDYHVYMN